MFRCTLIGSVVLGLLPACALPDRLEVQGSWVTPWAVENIDSNQWETARVVWYDNATNTAITQMPAEDEFHPNGFSKLVWTELNDESFHYCTVAFGLSTQDEALHAQDTSDPHDLDGRGCGGFPWTRMRRPVAIAGAYTSEFGQEDITATQWDHGFSAHAIKDWDNNAQWVVTQAPDDAEFSPNTFSTLFWIALEPGQPTSNTAIFYCTAAFALESLQDAQRAAQNAPNSDDPEQGGCGDFPWTKLELR